MPVTIGEAAKPLWRTAVAPPTARRFTPQGLIERWHVFLPQLLIILSAETVCPFSWHSILALTYRFRRAALQLRLGLLTVVT